METVIIILFIVFFFIGMFTGMVIKLNLYTTPESRAADKAYFDEKQKLILQHQIKIEEITQQYNKLEKRRILLGL